MELLREIHESDIGVEETKYVGPYKNREAARSIMLNDGQIALLFVSDKNYHKLPGGGLEDGESKEEALTREVLEETGCKVKVKSEIGETVEYRNQFNTRQTSYYFETELVQKLHDPDFTQEELAEGFKLVWVKLDEALLLMEKDQPADYVGKFISFRDKFVLNYFLSNLDKFNRQELPE